MALVLHITSAEDLKDIRRFKVGKIMHPYAMAWISTSRKGSRNIDCLHKIDPAALDRTSNLPRVDAEEKDDDGTLYPTWPKQHRGLQIPLQLQENAPTLRSAFLIIRIYGQRSRSSLPNPKSRRVVGTVTVPLADILLNDGRPVSSRWQLLSYNVKRPSGRLQGVLNFSVRFAPPPPPPPPLCHHEGLEFHHPWSWQQQQDQQNRSI